jgi:hypothetical protein
VDADFGVRLVSELAALERRTLGLLITYPRLSRPIAAAAGLAAAHFGQDDHRQIFAAWQVAGERDLPLVKLLDLARRALQSEGLWDETTPAGSTGMRHSLATLAKLATARPDVDEIISATNDGVDPAVRSIARHVVALVEAAEALTRGPA